MKITPYINEEYCKDDGYDDKTIRYYEEIDETGYFYELYVRIDGQIARIIVLDEGVEVDFDSGECTYTNITPNRLFPNCKSLCWDQLYKIVKTLEKIGIEGKTYSANEMDASLEKWKSLGEP